MVNTSDGGMFVPETIDTANANTFIPVYRISIRVRVRVRVRFRFRVRVRFRVRGVSKSYGPKPPILVKRYGHAVYMKEIYHYLNFISESNWTLFISSIYWMPSPVMAFLV